MGDNLNTLVRNLQSGDANAFDGIYALTHKSVYYAALTILKDPSLAEDIMQDTYLKFLKNPNAYHENNFTAYLVTIARNLAFNEYNARKKTTLTEDPESSHTPSLDSFVEIDALKKELIEKGLSVLDSFEKDVVLLYNIANLTHKEIAAVLGKPIGTITWAYAKALKKIREAIKED
jgi:RNA polymerase sigma-70 factor (ECF subfamily)